MENKHIQYYLTEAKEEMMQIRNQYDTTNHSSPNSEELQIGISNFVGGKWVSSVR